MKLDLYKSDERLAKDTQKIKTWKCSNRNKEFVYKFIERCEAEGLSACRRVKYLGETKQILKWLCKDLDKVNKDDIIRLVNKIQGNGYAQRTTGDFKNAIKKIYWVLFNDHVILSKFCDWMYDKRNNYLKANNKAYLQEKKGESLTKEEFKKVLSHCRTIRDKCLLAMQYEGGFRPSELLGIRIKDVYKNDYGFKVEVSGKTGPRPVFLVNSTPYIGQWLNSHPCGEKENFLFINMGNVHKGELISLAGASKILKNAMKEAGIDKPKNLYFLRSSAVTRDRKNGMSIGALEKKYGWIVGTRVLRSYDRSTAQDYENEIKKMNGIKGEEEKEEKIEKCQRCGSQLAFGESYCMSCGLAIPEQEKLNKIKEFLEQPKVMEMVGEFLNSSK